MEGADAVVQVGVALDLGDGLAGGGVGRGGELVEERQDGQAEGDLGAAFDERTAGERIAELVGRNV